MPTVAHFCSTFLKPDMQHVYRQITGLQAAGEFESVVITRRRENTEAFWFWEKKVRVIPKPPLRFLRRLWYRSLLRLPAVPLSFRECRDILYELQRIRAQLLHVYFGHVAVELLPVLRCCRIPVTVSFHGADAGVNVGGASGQRLRDVFAIATIIMARSEALMADLAGLGCPEYKLRLLRTGIPMESWTPPPSRQAPADGAWHLLQACRLVEKKGLFVTLEAFARLREAFPRAILTLAGDGPLEARLRTRAANLGLGDCVRFPGFLAQPALKEAFERAHLFLHPSQMGPDGNREGIPNALLEAMASGLPVVATRHGGIPEAVDEGISGMLVDEGDSTGLAAALQHYLGHPDALFAAGTAARLKIEQDFTQQRQVRAIAELYREVLQTDSRTA